MSSAFNDYSGFDPLAPRDPRQAQEDADAEDRAGDAGLGPVYPPFDATFDPGEATDDTPFGPSGWEDLADSFEDGFEDGEESALLPDADEAEARREAAEAEAAELLDRAYSYADEAPDVPQPWECEIMLQMEQEVPGYSSWTPPPRIRPVRRRDLYLPRPYEILTIRDEELVPCEASAGCTHQAMYWYGPRKKTPEDSGRNYCRVHLSYALQLRLTHALRR